MPETVAPLVSVVLPTRNRARLLSRAMRSVELQTFPDWELIAVDDGSADDTPTVLAQLAASNNRIRPCTGPGRGAAAARNYGASRARGMWLAFLDDDAEWLPQRLERQLTALADRPHAGAAYCVLMYHDADGGVRSIGNADAEANDARQRLLRRNVIDTSCVLVARAAFEAVAGFDEALPRLQDWDLWLRLAAITRFIFIDEPLVHGYFTPGSISSQSDALVSACCRLIAKLEAQPDTNRAELADWYYALGHTLMIGGAPREGRRRLLRAVSMRPWPPQRLLMTAAAMGGGRSYGLLSSLHRAVVER